MNPLILALLSPAIVGPVATALISVFKRLPVVNKIEDQSTRNVLFRGVGALLALVGVAGSFMLTGVTPDLSQVSDILVTLALTFVTLMTSIGTHNVLKK